MRKAEPIELSRNYLPLRKVRSVRLLTTHYNRIGEGSNEFTLECGHVVFAKQSAGEPHRKRCRECWQNWEAAQRALKQKLNEQR